jgi:curved DNA-binding protein CbpA
MDEIKRFFKKNNISPYNILEIDKDCDKSSIKKAYRKKALDYHPDKNQKYDTTLEFQIITMAYEYCRYKLKKNNKKEFSELKNKFKEDLNELDKQTYDSDVDIEDVIRRPYNPHGYSSLRSNETDYSKSQIHTPEQLMKNFNSDKFNAIFEHLKNEKGEYSKELIKKPEGFEKINLANCKVITDGEIMIMGEDDELEDYTKDNMIDYKQGFMDFEQPNKRDVNKMEIDYKRTKVKSQLKKLNGSEIKSIVNERFKPLNVKYDKNFAESQVDFLNNQMESMRLDNQKNKQYISKKSNISKLLKNDSEELKKIRY